MTQIKVTKCRVARCLWCKNSSVGAINLWQNRDTFHVDCNELSRIPAGNCPLFKFIDPVNPQEVSA